MGLFGKKRKSDEHFIELLKKAMKNHDDNNHRTAISIYDEVLDDLGSDKHSYELGFLLEALMFKGNSLLCLKRQEEAIECYDWV